MQAGAHANTFDSRFLTQHVAKYDYLNELCGGFFFNESRILTKKSDH